MKEKKDCKIVLDLLPNYIEKLTSEETNTFIKEHLDNCKECNKAYENMQRNLDFNTEKPDKREVKYFKKYKNKLTILKIILLIIIVAFATNTIRKMVIISNLSNKAEKCVENTNFHKTSYISDINTYTKSEVFGLEDRLKIISTQLTEEGKKNKKIYFAKKIAEDQIDKYLVNIYVETENSKKAVLNTTMQMSVGVQNTLYTKNMWHLFLYSIPASIKKTTFYGSDCYYIANFQSPYMLCSEGMYINTNNGLPMSTISYEYESVNGEKARMPAMQNTFEFNSVTEKDFVEPDLSEYEIVENQNQLIN